VDVFDRLVTSGDGWAYIKIAEARYHCAYCVIHSIRVNTEADDGNIIGRLRIWLRPAIKELIVVASGITRYGADLYGRPSLSK
jgi:tRNA A37 methylthiotransferase MiaB